MEAKLYGQNKGGMSINGIIKDYYAYAGENISAGDLVEYIEGIASKTDYGTSADTVVNNTTTYTGYTISAVQLDNSRVFVAHSYGSNYHLYGVVLTIEGGTITVGTDTQLSADLRAGYAISVVKLDENRVFIAHNYTNNYYLRGMVCTINGETITCGTDTVLNQSTTYTGFVISAVLLPNGNVFIAHSYYSNYHLYGMIVTIDGTTITAGTDTAIATSQYAGYRISTCLLPNGNVFIAHSYSSSYYLYGMVVSIDGTTITAGSDTQLSSATYTAYDKTSTVSLPNGNVFIAHGREKNYYYLYGMVCSVNGTTITAGTDTNLGASQYGARVISAVLLINGNVFVVHSYDGNYYHAGIVCTISGTSITSGTWVKFSEGSDMYMGYSISTVLLSNGTIFIAHSNSTNYYLNAQIFAVDENNIPTNQIIADYYETQVRKVTTGQFDGVAKTSGTGGDDTGHNDLVSIWTLE